MPRRSGRLSSETVDTMEAILSIDEIERTFRGEWVLLADPELDDHQRLLGGRLLFHDVDREAVNKRARKLHPARSALLFAGGPSRDIAFSL